MNKTALKLLNTSIVVLAQDHNPTILHPAFLETQEIVPKGWKVEDAPLCTPGFSLAKYNNGITFSVESARLTVTEEVPAGNPDKSRIPSLAVAYVKKLPHVRYRSLGINFTGYVFVQEPEEYLINRFLKTGPWNEEGRLMKNLGARFVYHVEDAVLRFGLDGGMVEREERPEPAILINGNFHSQLPDEETVKILCNLAQRWDDRLTDFTNLTTVILGLEESQ